MVLKNFSLCSVGLEPNLLLLVVLHPSKRLYPVGRDFNALSLHLYGEIKAEQFVKTDCINLLAYIS